MRNVSHFRARPRNSKGLMVTVLLFVLAVFVIGVLSMFVYELICFNLCEQQLKAAVDSAALTAACSTTSSNSSSPSVTQTQAMNQAAYMFAQNSIMNVSLTSTPAYTYGTSPPTFTPAGNQAQLYFEFLDPVTLLPVPYGSANGKIIRVFGSFGFVPVFAKYIGIGFGPFVATEVSDGGLPMLDVVLCFDMSSSMDDFTNVSLVNRYWDPIHNIDGYALTPPQNGGTIVGGNPIGQGPLYYAFGGTNPIGLGLNATYPMSLSASGAPGNQNGVYSFNLAGHGPHTGAAAPQTLPTMNSTAGGYSYSDCVVNLDGTSNEANGVTINGFYFPPDIAPNHYGLGVLVEAARGNLESAAAAKAAGLPLAALASLGVLPKPGYFQAYYQAAYSAQAGFPDANVTVPLRHPVGDAIVAAQNFFGILSNDADSHFGLETFSTNAGVKSSPTDLTPGPGYYVGSYNALASTEPTPITPYPTEPIQPPNPAIYLNPTLGPSYSNYSSASPAPSTSVNGALFGLTGSASTYNVYTVMAEGETNIQDALDRALAMHLGSKAGDPTTTPDGRPALSLGRPGAVRAIVLFTDGLPNGGGDSGTSDPASQAEARFAKTAGIPIYTIGLCLNPSLQANQTTVLTDAPGSTGIAALSGNGATFAQTTSSTGLNSVFQNIARQLVQLVK